MSELKPCPFCGGVAQVINTWTMHGITGLRCSCSNPDCPNSVRTVALATWNMRHIEDALNARIAELEQELNTTDGLLKEATETIGAVVACCTYNSNDDAKIGIYGIDQKAFTRIDQFITHYNDAVSAGKVSVDVKRELTDAEIEELGAQEAERKEFCPNCEAETPCTHEAELYVCDICGEDFAKYIVSRNCNVSDVTTPEPPEDALNARIAELEAERRWIPVGERSPESGKRVLICRGDNVAVGWFEIDDAGDYYSNCWDDKFGWGEPTHWMPLPKLPEVQE